MKTIRETHLKVIFFGSILVLAGALTYKADSASMPENQILTEVSTEQVDTAIEDSQLSIAETSTVSAPVAAKTVAAVVSPVPTSNTETTAAPAPNSVPAQATVATSATSSSPVQNKPNESLQRLLDEQEAERKEAQVKQDALLACVTEHDAVLDPFYDQYYALRMYYIDISDVISERTRGSDVNESLRQRMVAAEEEKTAKEINKLVSQINQLEAQFYCDAR